MLIEHGADVNGAGAFNALPLCTAARRRDGEMMSLLLRSGADPNRTTAGESALTICANDANPGLPSVMLLL